MKLLLSAALILISLNSYALEHAKLPNKNTNEYEEAQADKVPNFIAKDEFDQDLISTNAFRWSLEKDSKCKVKVTNIHTDVSFTDGTLCETVKTHRL